MQIPDETLCRRLADHDTGAFETLVERYQGRAYRLAWSILRDAEEARDVCQEAFIRLYQTGGTFRGEARFSTWFYRILVNLCLDHRRKQRWWRILFAGGGDELDGAGLDRHAAPFDHPLDSLGKEQTMKRLWEAVDRLSPRQRAAVHLMVGDGLSSAEVASVLECSEATVRVHLHRALMALRKTVRGD